MQDLPKRAKIYIPKDATSVRGCIQIIHGMTEHQMRYQHVADFFKTNGFVVITSDLRGHGENIASDEDLGHFGGVAELVADVKELFRYLKKKYPGKPCFLIGHSMGSLIATSYFQVYADDIDGLILSGIPGENPAAFAGKLLIRILAVFRGWRYRSKMLAHIINDPFKKAFPDEKDPLAWLSTEKDIIDQFRSDKKCGFVFTLKGYDTLMSLMLTVYGRKPWKGKRKDIPIRLISGAEDPCRVNDKTFLKSVQIFRRAGYSHVTYELIPNQRHEIFNDTKSEETLHSLLEYIHTIF